MIASGRCPFARAPGRAGSGARPAGACQKGAPHPDDRPEQLRPVPTASSTCTRTPSSPCSTARPGSTTCSASRPQMGMPALAMTDHGNVFGAYEFWRKANAHGVKPIIGMEGYLAPGSRHERKRATLGGQSVGQPRREPGRDVHPHDAAGREHRGHAQPVPAGQPGLAGGLLLQAADGPRAAGDLRQGDHRHHRLPVRRGAAAAAAGPVRRRLPGRERLPGHLRQGELLLRADGPRHRHRAPGPRRAASS